MEPTGMTIVSQLLTDARSRHGAYAVRVLEVSGDLLDEVMEHVLQLGGEVGLDHCVVEGTQIRELPEDAAVPRVLLVDEDEPRELAPLED